MTQKIKTEKGDRDYQSLMEKIEALKDPEIDEYIADVKARYGKYARPIEDVRKILSETMGDVTLTDILFEMRKKSF